MRTVGGMETERHVIVDGNNVLQRAFYVFVESRMREGKPLLSGPKGYPTGIIYGFLSFLGSWLYSMQPVSKISIFFDGLPTRRRAIDSNYKIKRGETKHDLKFGLNHLPLRLRDGTNAENDVSVLSHILKLLGCDIYHNQNEEADDLIATFCAQNPGTIRTIVSDDKDFFQLLIDPRIIMFRPGSKDHRFCDAAGAENVWGRLLKGKHPKVPCSQVRMFKTLCGDSSDSIPGVPMLRKKIAMTVCHLPTVDAIYASGLTKFSDSEKIKTIESRPRIQLNWELIGLKDDLDLSQSLYPSKFDYNMVTEICREDLLMWDLDLVPFRPSTPSIPKSVEIPSWLSDI